jgi:hypothetical protein
VDEIEPFSLSAFLRDRLGNIRPVSIRITRPATTPAGVFACEVRSSLLLHDPHPVYSGLPHDAWAKAFAVLRNALRNGGYELVDGKGSLLILPNPPRDHSWVPPPTQPNIAGIEPSFRAEGWTRWGGEPRLVELAVWPPFEEEPGTYCAPMRCGLMRGGQVICSYGASPEQAVHLAHKYLQIEVDFRKIIDEAGRPIEIPIPPEPPLRER